MTTWISRSGSAEISGSPDCVVRTSDCSLSLDDCNSLFLHNTKDRTDLMGLGKGKPSLFNGNRINQIQHDHRYQHYRLFNGAEIFLHKREIQRLFLKELGGVPRVEGNGTERIFNRHGQRWSGRWTWHYQGSAVGIFRSLQKELLLVIFLQMKIENTVRRQYLQRQTPEGYLPAGLLPWQKELQCSGNGMQPDTVPYKGVSPAGKRSERVFFPASAR